MDSPTQPDPGHALAPAALPDRSLRGRVLAFQARHQGKTMLFFFVGGFIFDAVMLSRIDEPPMLIQQGTYLAVCGVLLALTQRLELKGLQPPARLRKAWHYVPHLIHFMLGTLLNAYTIFYFQSASGFTAVGFVVVICALLALNELPRFQKLGPIVLYALYSICLTSYFAYLFPVLIGHIRPWMFYLAVVVALVPLALHVSLLLRWSRSLGHVARHAALPAFGVQGAFILLYALRIAPPVPLAAKEMGIYHRVERLPDGRHLFHQKAGWRFWLQGDQEFRERAGDRVYCFARIFAPARFHDRIDIAWFQDDPRKGWVQYYRLPLSVSASGARGFATDAFITQPPPGRWRVEIQSEDGRTIGQLHFRVIPDAETGERELEESVSSSERPAKKS